MPRGKHETAAPPAFPQEQVDLKLITHDLEEISQKYYCPQPWTAEEDELLRKFYRKVPIEEIGKIFTKHGRPRGRGAISHRLHLLGIRGRHRRPMKNVKGETV